MEALFGLLGTLLGSFIAWLTSDRHTKMQTTLELHREFNSGEVLKSRRPADKVFAKYMDKTYDKFSSSLEPEEYSHIWSVINFYQRLWVVIKHKQLVNRMIPDLFGEVFMRWYIPYFKEMIVPHPQDWSTGNNIKELKNWFENNSDKASFGKWSELGKQDRENIMKRLGLLSDDTEQK